MQIQKIVFPKPGTCMQEDLYYQPRDFFREDGGERSWMIEKAQAYEEGLYTDRSMLLLDSENEAIMFNKGAKTFFHTYFNGFSIDKWKKYTTLDNLSLTLKLKGRFKVELYSLETIHNEVFKHVISEHFVNGTGDKINLVYNDMTQKGMYSFSLMALEDDAVFFGGSYDSEVKTPLKNAKIGICICTFKREDYIEKNMRILNDAILKNPDSPLYGHLEIFISDNGKTLDIEKLSSESIHIFPNRNLGGAGGFTRDLIEILKGNDKYGITHPLLMDDDVIIDPQALVKTYMILSMIKEEHKDAFIGGAMLRRDKQFFQVEAGAQWNGGKLLSLKAGRDLRDVKNVLANEIEEYREFNAWWYCCFPVEVVKEDNLPLPIFIRGDDLEYGLRNMKELILMNGICLWHEPFEYKYSSFLQYYIMRNQLIDNSFHCKWYGVKEAVKDIKHSCMVYLVYYRYKDLDLYLRGIEDFLKGPSFLMETDGEALHKEIMTAGYKFEPIEKLDAKFTIQNFEKNLIIQDSVKARIKRILTYNGLTLPASGTAAIPVGAPKSIMAYRKKKLINYDASVCKGFVTVRDRGEWRRARKKMRKVIGKVKRNLPRVQEQYRTAGLELRKLDFWVKYLELDK